MAPKKTKKRDVKTEEKPAENVAPPQPAMEQPPAVVHENAHGNLGTNQAAPLTVAQKVDGTIETFNHAFERLFEAAREALGTPDSVKLLAHQKEWAGMLKKMEELVKEPLKAYVLTSPDAVKEGATTKLVIGDWEVPVSVANQPPAENEPLEPRHVDPEKLEKYLSQKFDMPATGFLRRETKWHADGLSDKQEKALRAVLANPEHAARIRAACLKEPGAPTLRPLKLAKTENPLPLHEGEVRDE